MRVGSDRLIAAGSLMQFACWENPTPKVISNGRSVENVDRRLHSIYYLS